jgi:hypothetical protein
MSGDPLRLAGALCQKETFSAGRGTHPSPDAYRQSEERSFPATSDHESRQARNPSWDSPK